MLKPFMNWCRPIAWSGLGALALVWAPLVALAQAPATPSEESRPVPASAQEPPPKPGLKRLVPDCDVWIDPQRRQVILRGKIVLREGPLELFACMTGTKEHEAVIAIRTKAHVVHAALLAVGAEPGGAVQFFPEYRPAAGTAIGIELAWTDGQGQPRTANAAEWIKNTKTNQPLAVPWVFGGSGFWEHPETGERFYMAEDGDLICVSNFASATLDLPIESSQANDALLFEAWTERIPPLETPVVLTLIPQRPPASGSK